MHPSLLLLLLILLPLSAASSLPHHHSDFTKSRLRRSSEPPREYVEIARPLSTDSLTPSCTLQILSHSFGNCSAYRAPTNTTYSHPLNCRWSRAVLHLSAAANGSQRDRIAAVWLSGAEILRTSPPESTSNEAVWNVRKDVTRYSSLLRKSNLTLSVMLENVVNGVYHLNLTVLFYDVATNETAVSVNSPLSLFSPNRKAMIRELGELQPVSIPENYSLEMDENPADLIIPISASGEEGFWFKIQSQHDAIYHGIKIPPNTYRAVIEVYASFHGYDEFWYSNLPDSYIQLNHLPTKRGNGAYREVVVRIDNNVAGSLIPFPVIYAGGINPLFWEPLVSIGAFDIPSYEIELTPFLGTLLDEKVHYLGLGVSDALSFWLVDANLHLWLDTKVDKVQAGVISPGDPSKSEIERESKFQQLDGKFEVEGTRKIEVSGWVNSSAGNITTIVTSKVKLENEIKLKSNGTVKDIDHEVKMTSKVTLKSDAGQIISYVEVEKKYPLEMTITSLPGSGSDDYLMITKLENSMEEERKNGTFKSSLTNTQKSNGWMFVEDCNVISGASSTHQTYEIKDSFGCYSRDVLAEDGSIKSDTEYLVCAVVAAS
ncbi:peptide-N4-(N-acetyl-beta-glucosaminyl)asparagine amidase A-like [Andrographis paniculata]|uniref:peptide-N4-(N-acetyl-beta- glucosaminyl)asparagine amidase A-like n=1 Tax=Andrographis paniculata TaxID=175694 RepID=UPI0021E861B9|nr:peptide-N4-(N-acetyl-beta-glucosaminyl)asparagine amidase A-like [Andrographis paniculata]